MKEALIKYFKYFFPVLIIFYLGGIISFTHVHIEDGVTIVHSHPYKSHDSSTGHKHSGAELQFLHQLSTIQIGGFIALFISLASFLSVFRLLSNRPVVSEYRVPVKGKRRLRAPPYSL